MSDLPPILGARMSLSLPLAPSLPCLDGIRAVWLVGIEGVGMSAAAEILQARGVVVRGADCSPGPRARRLEGLGVEIHAETVLPASSSDLLVASAAIPPDHPHLREARRRGLEVWKYAELVGALMAGRDALCVAGCHGKTTTTSLAASVLLRAGRDPTFLIGGALTATGSGARSGLGRHFVAESCEFDRSFHHHDPMIGVVLNVDEDHLDYYEDLAEIQEAFRVFAAKVPADGLLVVGDAYAPLFAEDDRIRAPLETYGFGEDATWQVGESEPAGKGERTRFALRYRGEPLGVVDLPLLGRHNALNATAAVAALTKAGLSFEEIQHGLAHFEGVGRRLERIADKGGVLILDDYGHHPAEIRATIRALRHCHPKRRLIVVFQPHQASRTRCLLKEFAAALAEADEAWIPPPTFATRGGGRRRCPTSNP